MPQDLREMLKEKWQQALQDIEQTRNDLMPEHQKMQKRSQKLQSLRDKKTQCQKDMAKWVGDCERAKNEIQERLASIEECGQKIEKTYCKQGMRGVTVAVQRMLLRPGSGGTPLHLGSNTRVAAHPSSSRGVQQKIWWVA